MSEVDRTRWGLDPLGLQRKVNKREAAAILGLSERGVQALKAAGKIPHYKIGRAVRFRVSDLLDFCERHRQEAVRG